jgi:hypothetical protein
MLWIREAEVFSEVDDASAGQRCRDLDLHGIAGYVCRENPEAAPHLFCHYLCLGLRLAMARLPLDSAQEHLPARDNRIPGHWITVPKSCLRHGAWLQSSQLAIDRLFGHIGCLTWHLRWQNVYTDRRNTRRRFNFYFKN